jgi:hypothetical protein
MLCAFCRFEPVVAHHCWDLVQCSIADVYRLGTYVSRFIPGPNERPDYFRIGVCFAVAILCGVANAKMRATPKSIWHPIANGELGLDFCASALAVGLTTSLALIVHSYRTGHASTTPIDAFGLSIAIGMSIALALGGCVYGLQASSGYSRKRFTTMAVLFVPLVFVLLLEFGQTTEAGQWLSLRAASSLVDGLTTTWFALMTVVATGGMVFTQKIMLKLRTPDLGRLTRKAWVSASLMLGTGALIFNVAYADMGTEQLSQKSATKEGSCRHEISHDRSRTIGHHGGH